MNKQALLDCWTMFRREYDSISIDRLLCNASLRGKFVDAAHKVDPNAAEEQILWRLISLRKAKQISRTPSQATPK